MTAHPKTNVTDIEIAVANLFGVRDHLIVPNVSWGLLNHEADMLIIRPSGAAIEVEIKISVSDLKRDVLKRHGHRDNRIKHLYFAVPEEILEKALPHIPDDAGVIVVSVLDEYGGIICHRARYYRRPKTRGTGHFPPEKIQRLAELGVMRYWDMKKQARERMRRELAKIETAQNTDQ